MLTGNKGEWSEVYVLLRMLADGRLYAADSELNRLDDMFFPVLKVIREEVEGEIKEYFTGKTVKIYVNGQQIQTIPNSEFIDEADSLLNNIKSIRKGTFSVERTEDFMEKILCYKLAAPSKDKSDITLQIIDVNTGYQPVVGFSIKSQLGSLPTLLNAGNTTNFVYKIKHSDSNLINEANSIYRIRNGESKIDVKGRIHKIIEKGGSLEYSYMQNEVFNSNLELIDSSMDKIIAETLLYFYRDGITYCKDMISKLEVENPMNYRNINAYQYKFKKFLAAAALGMTPAKVWDGMDDATGGYIIVTREGEVLAYHIYNRNYFEEYLLNNTKYDTPSTSRYGFGEIYSESNDSYMKLNLQVRFK